MKPVGKTRVGLTKPNNRRRRTAHALLALALVALAGLIAVRVFRKDGALARCAAAESAPPPTLRSTGSTSDAFQPRRVRSASHAVTGTVYEVSSSGIPVAQGHPLPALVVPTRDEEDRENAEAEWEAVVAELENRLSKSEHASASRRLSRALKRLPKARRGEALRSALNLVPEENLPIVAVLALDRTQDEEIIDIAFSAVLGGGDELKAYMLVRIVADRTHPNYTDAARLLDFMRLNRQVTAQ